MIHKIVCAPNINLQCLQWYCFLLQYINTIQLNWTHKIIRLRTKLLVMTHCMLIVICHLFSFIDFKSDSLVESFSIFLVLLLSSEAATTPQQIPYQYLATNVFLLPIRKSIHGSILWISITGQRWYHAVVELPTARSSLCSSCINSLAPPVY